MKKRILSLIVVMMFSLLLISCAKKEQPAQESASGDKITLTPSVTEGGEEVSATLQKLREKGVLTVGAANDIPFAYLDLNTNEFMGLDADIIKEICSRLGIAKVEMKFVPFENLLIELNKGSIDMVTDGMYVRDNRMEQALFTDKWYSNYECILVKKDSGIQSKQDLSSKVIGVQKGCAYMDQAVHWKKEGIIKDIVVTNSQPEQMLAVNSGKIDACINDGIVARYTLNQDDSLSLQSVPDYEPELYGEIGAALRFEDKDFLAEVNDALNAMKEDGTLLSILENNGLTEDYFLSVEDGKTVNIE